MTENALVPSGVYDEYGTGLEDLDPNEVQVPRIKIDHPNAVFVDSITGEEFPKLDGVFLGMVKQRTMWRKDYNGESDARPQCKSNDAAIGFPNMDSTNAEDHFPWSETGLNPAAMDRDEHGRITIPCETCPFSKWTGTRIKPKPPRCAELHAYPVMYASEDGGEIDRAGIVTFKGSGIRPSKAFLKGFAAAKRAVYTSRASVTLKPEQNGMIRYAVPVFSKGAAVPEDQWPIYGEELKGLREILREPPRFFTDEDRPAGVTIPAPTQPSYTPPQAPQQAAPAPAAPAATGSVLNQASGPVTPPPAQDDEELPF